MLLRYLNAHSFCVLSAIIALLPFGAGSIINYGMGHYFTSFYKLRPVAAGICNRLTTSGFVDQELLLV